MAYIDGDLKSALNEDLIKEIKFEALQSSIPKDITNHSIEIDKELINLPQIFIPNFEMLKNSTTSSQIIEVGEVKYLLSEQRRIFKNESHYFDHPKIGVIISVYDSSL